MEKKLGKIESVKFGLGGYQECQFGITFELSAGLYSISDFKGPWDPEQMECTKSCKWTETDRDNQLVELCRFVSKLLFDAKVNDVSQLKNIPVEITFEGNTLKDWRVLTEVL